MLKMEQLIEKVQSKQNITYGGDFANKLSNIYKMFNYILKDETDYVFPYKSAQAFNKALKSYKPFQFYFRDMDTKYPKIAISFGKAFNDKFFEETKKTSNNKNIESVAEFTADKFNSINSTSDIDDKRINLIETEPQIKPYNMLFNSNPNEDCLVVIAAPGLGKTEAVVDYIKILPEDVQIIVPSFRCALAEKQMWDFKELGFKHYKDKDFGGADSRIIIEKHRRVVCQIDSLQRVRSKERYKGVLILDEIESIIEHVNSSPYIQNRQGLIAHFVRLIREAFRVIVMDANLSNGTVEFLGGICKRKVFIYKNLYIRNERFINILATKAQVEDTVIKFINDGKKVYIPTNSRNWGLKFLGDLQTAYPNLKFKIYDKETKVEKDCDPISDMINYDCTIVTPKFQAGNSFTQDHFDVVCGYFSGASCSPQGSSQLLMRVRNVKDPNVYLYVDNRIGGDKKPIKTVNSFDDMVKYMKDYTEDLSGEIEYAVSQNEFSKLKLLEEDKLDLEDPATFVAIMNKYNMNEGYKDYRLKFMSLLKGMGFKFASNMAPTTKEEIADMNKKEKAVTAGVKKTREDNEVKYSEALVAAAIPDQETYDNIVEKMKNGEATKEEKVQVKKVDLLHSVRIHPTVQNKPEIFRKALEIKRPKALMNKLLPTLAKGLNKEQLEITLVNTFNELNYNEIENPSNAKLAKFYKLKNTAKTKTIIMLYSILTILGFEYGFFDIRVVDIKNTKQQAIDYLARNKRDFEESWGNLTESQTKATGFMKWLNGNLKSLLDISLMKNSNTATNYEYFIKSDWLIDYKRYIDNGKLVSIDEFEVISKSVEIGSELPPQLEEEQFKFQVIKYSEWFYANKGDAYTNGTFRQCYEIDDRYPGSYVIINHALWDKHLKLNEGNAQFMAEATKIYKGHMLRREFLTNTYKGDSEAWRKFLKMKEDPLRQNVKHLLSPEGRRRNKALDKEYDQRIMSDAAPRHRMTEEERLAYNANVKPVSLSEMIGDFLTDK
jgi:hypothetical protein